VPDLNRKYNEEEIAALLERTAQLQADDATTDRLSSQGLSLSELESIASEAGLDPEYLHRAALEIESNGKKGFQKRTKTHIYIQRYLPSELSEDLWEEMVFELRGSFGGSDLTGSALIGNGVVEQIGRSREWRHMSSLGVQTSVLLRPYKEGTRIEMSQLVGVGSPKTEAITYGLILSLIPAFILAVTMGKSLPIGVISLAGFMALLVPLVYYFDTRWRDQKLIKLESVANRLVEMASETSDQVFSGNEMNLAAKAPNILDGEDEGHAPESVQAQRDKRARS